MRLRRAYWSIYTDLAIALRVPSTLRQEKNGNSSDVEKKKKTFTGSFQHARHLEAKRKQSRCVRRRFVKRFRCNEIINNAVLFVVTPSHTYEELPEISRHRYRIRSKTRRSGRKGRKQKFSEAKIKKLNKNCGNRVNRLIWTECNELRDKNFIRVVNNNRDRKYTRSIVTWNLHRGQRQMRWPAFSRRI